MEDSYFLRETFFAFHTPEYCLQALKRYNPKHKICAGESGRGTASGDSGGPLLKNGDDGKWYQVGICSYGKRGEMDKKKHPGKSVFGFREFIVISVNSVSGVSTRISYYCPWIEKVTKGEVKCVPYEKQTIENSAPSESIWIFLFLIQFPFSGHYILTAAPE